MAFAVVLLLLIAAALSVVHAKLAPTTPPTISPTARPSAKPTTAPSVKPTTITPSVIPTTISPSIKPTTISPSVKPTAIAPSAKPTVSPSVVPSTSPTQIPSANPTTFLPSFKPTTISPSARPTSSPSVKPSTFLPSVKPSTTVPSLSPSIKPTSYKPSIVPTAAPSYKPTTRPSTLPTFTPTATPSSSAFLVHAVLPRGYAVQNGISTSNGKLFSSSASENLLFDIAYNGGSFMDGQVNLYNIYYGSSNTQALIDYFAANIGNSAWYTTMKHYSGGGKAISGTVSFVTSKYISSTVTTLTDSAIKNTLAGLFFAKTLTADSDGIYAFIFKGDITFNGWLSQWCGYHSFFTYNGKTIKYFVAGDSSFSTSGSACQGYQNGATANNNVGADSLASVYAHELVATVSDFSGRAFYAATPAGLQENADLCAWNWGSFLPGSVNANVVVGSKNFLIQQNWLPGVGCVLNDASISTETPTIEPTVAPTETPSLIPIYTPTEEPSSSPNFVPSEEPTFLLPSAPSESPTTASPVTASPTEIPTTASPVTASPTEVPSVGAPTEDPSAAAPTEVPSAVAPTEVPTTDPTFVQSITPTAVSTVPFPTLRVPSYSAINTFSATIRTVPYNFTACPGVLLKISDCDPSRCFSGRRSSDQFIRLYNSTKSQVAFNDDSCSSCSTIYYTTQGPCQLYTLQQGCYMNRFCTGKFSIQMISAPTAKPTLVPTIATTVEPTISFAPSSSNTLTCPFSTPVLRNRGDLRSNGVSCGPFQFCPGMKITIQDTSPFCQGLSTTSNQRDRERNGNFAEFIAVYDNNNSPKYDAYIQYSTYRSSAPCQSAIISSHSSSEWWHEDEDEGGGSCKQYTLYMGCGSSACSTNGGQYTISTTITPTAAPTVARTRPNRGRRDDD